MMGLLNRMLKEEWRMHSSLFGSLKFSLFPGIIFLMSLATFYAFDSFGFSMNEIQFGMHYVMLFFGLNVGVIGFVSRSSMKNLLGKTNLLVFSSRFLPVSKLFILSMFVLKDFIFYFGFFILPVVFANLVLTSLGGIWILLVSYFLSFVSGLAVTFFLSVFYVRISKYVFVPLLAVSAYFLHFFGFGLRRLNPGYLFYLVNSPEILFSSVLGVGIVLLFSGIFYGFERRTDNRQRKNMFSVLNRKMSGLESKNLLDLKRSSGGFGKIVVSFLVLGAVFWFMVEQFPPGRIFKDAKLLTFATFLGISSLSIYNWLNRYDNESSYTILPLTRTDVMRSKVRSFYLISMPLLFVAVVSGFFIFGSNVYELVHAMLVTFFSSTYILAITVKLTGLEPNIKLLDSVTVSKFIGLSFLVLEPLLIVGLVFESSFMLATLVLSVMYLVSGTVSALIFSDELDW